MIDQATIKKFYRFAVLRKYLLGINSSGLYDISEVRKCSKASAIPYNTLRKDLKWFAASSLIATGNNVIKLNGLHGAAQSLYNLFINHQAEIEKQKKPALYFSDLYKRKAIYTNVYLQIKREAEKCNDSRSGKKLLKIVKSTHTPVGANSGIHLSLQTIARIVSRSKTTAFRYIERLHKAGIMTRIKHDSFVCPLNQYSKFRSDELYGRLFIKQGCIYERLQNSYIF